MPFSSNVFTKLASVYLGGGSEKLCLVWISSFFTSSFLFKYGIFAIPNSSDSFSSSVSSTYNVMNPLNFIDCPVVLKLYSFAFISIVIVSYTADVIWLAMNLLYINLYSLYWSGVRYSFICSGDKSGYDGLIASWASCESFFTL